MLLYACRRIIFSCLTLLHQFIVLQAVAKQMEAQGTRDTTYSIVNTSSVAGLRGTPAMVAYASSKAAVLAMTVSAFRFC